MSTTVPNTYYVLTNLGPYRPGDIIYVDAADVAGGVSISALESAGALRAATTDDPGYDSPTPVSKSAGEVPRLFLLGGPPSSGDTGSYAGAADTGSLLIDISQKVPDEYLNTGSKASPTWTRITRVGTVRAVTTVPANYDPADYDVDAFDDDIILVLTSNKILILPDPTTIPGRIYTIVNGANVGGTEVASAGEGATVAGQTLPDWDKSLLAGGNSITIAAHGTDWMRIDGKATQAPVTITTSTITDGVAKAAISALIAQANATGTVAITED